MEVEPTTEIQGVVQKYTKFDNADFIVGVRAKKNMCWSRKVKKRLRQGTVLRFCSEGKCQLERCDGGSTKRVSRSLAKL